MFAPSDEVEAEEEEDGEEEEEAPLPPAVMLHFFVQERQERLLQLPGLLRAKREELQKLCGELKEQYLLKSMEQSGLFRAQVLREWLERQLQHVCKPPGVAAPCDAHGRPAEWEAARAAAMLHLVHLQSCVSMEKDKAGLGCDRLQSLHDESTQQMTITAQQHAERWHELRHSAQRAYLPTGEVRTCGRIFTAD